MVFRNREEAGKKLAQALLAYRNQHPIVLAVPRGGVVVAYQVAKRLNAPLDLIIPRKIGAPYNPELAIGAVAQDGTVILDERITSQMYIDPGYINSEAERQMEEINRRMEEYRGNRPFPSLAGRVVIVVDDGIATGATILAGLKAVQQMGAAKIVLAVPVAPPDTVERLRREVDEVVCLLTPEPFYAVGQFYAYFEQTTDEEVKRYLSGV